MSKISKKIFFLRRNLQKDWKMVFEPLVAKNEIEIEWGEFDELADADEFVKLVESKKDCRILVEEVPFEWVQDFPWSWSQSARALRCFDELYFSNGRWQVNLQFPEALRLVLIEESSTFDLSQPIYVVGDGERVRLCAWVASQLGFRKLYFVSPDAKALNEDITLLKNFLFGMEFALIDPERLTQQTENGPLVINTCLIDSKNTLSNDLVYFNYMSPNGIVLDFAPELDQSYFIGEATKADMRVLSLERVLQKYVKNMTRVQ